MYSLELYSLTCTVLGPLAYIQVFKYSYTQAQPPTVRRLSRADKSQTVWARSLGLAMNRQLDGQLDSQTVRQTEMGRPDMAGLLSGKVADQARPASQAGQIWLALARPLSTVQVGRQQTSGRFGFRGTTKHRF